MKGGTSWHSSTLPQKRERTYPPSFLSCPSFPQFSAKGWPLFWIRRPSQLSPSFPLCPTLCRFSLPAIYRRQIVKVYVSCCAVFASSSVNDWFLSRDDRGKHSPSCTPRKRDAYRFIILKGTLCPRTPTNFVTTATVISLEAHRKGERYRAFQNHRCAF